MHLEHPANAFLFSFYRIEHLRTRSQGPRVNAEVGQATHKGIVSDLKS